VFLGLVLGAGILVDQIVGCMSAPAQQRGGVSMVTSASAATLPATVDALIRQMSRSAGIVFAGEVIAVRPPVGFAGSPADAAEGVVEIDFRVDQAVRGAEAGSVYTLREWAGLWTGGMERYRPGQRRLMLLHAAGARGFASPVHGPEGAIPLRGMGRAPGPYGISSADSSVQPALPAQWMVDVRWLQAQTLRPQFGLSAIPIRRGHLPVPESMATSGDARPAPVHALPGPWLDPAAPAAAVEPLSQVLAICSDTAEPSDAQR
jgi:hypothetical protein